ncbi:DEAD/DEAH box helicase [Streptomyces sp. NRRL WC-3744]|uniref:DEAD/DEAH box helicase n=1 Tax=Streptomyces sp. NRRL WC-3744 TaxID=1463935 RepID=UPI0006646871|nr:DEAD/DEAH box helicase [Streptomyces sp. NRRL WC-3744]
MTDTAWRWWETGQQVVQVLAEQHLFGQDTLDVYAPAEGRVYAVEAEEVLNLRHRHWKATELMQRAVTLRVLSEAQSHPIAAGTRVDLLPHQVSILRRALRLARVRLAICCEVGLGKTTTAGAIATELVARGRISRILVVAPKGVQLQWVAEMREKFGVDFTRIGPEGVPIDAEAAVWRAFDFVVTSLDAIKPLRRRAGWTQQQLDAYNAARVRGVAAAGWDLVVIDEAHHVAGSSVEVARHQVALSLSASSENLLLLSATPHSGKSEAFRRFLGLLDERFRHGRDINASTVADVVARSDKRTAVDHVGRPLFHPRTTRLETVMWDGHPLHRELYDAVTEYVREGYLNARAVGDTARSFLMLLFQRLVASSTAAIVAALEKRLEALEHTSRDESEQLAWDELDDDECQLLFTRPRVSAGDLADLSRLVNLARHTLSAETDPKTVHFLRLLRALQRDEHDPEVKILIFTQFRATQRAIVKVLDAQGIRTTTVDGTMGLAERAEMQEAFRKDAQVLVSTDAGGEGVNLQFAHIVVNWDLPWTPTLLEQRIGRVDRIGQRVPVRAFNFALADSVDQRVLEVLEAKLALILQELGVDKRGEVLTTVDALADDLYITAIVAPDALAAAGEAFLISTRSELDATFEERTLLTNVTVAPPRRAPSSIPALVERLDAQTGGKAKAALRRNDIVVPGEPVPAVELEAGTGWLAIARVATGDSNAAVAAFAVFLPDGGRPDPRLGRALLDRLADTPSVTLSTVPLTVETHATLSKTLTDFGYQHLCDLGNGRVPKLPSLRLALVVRCK